MLIYCRYSSAGMLNAYLHPTSRRLLITNASVLDINATILFHCEFYFSIIVICSGHITPFHYYVLLLEHLIATQLYFFVVQSIQCYYLFSLRNEHLNNFADLDFLFFMINDQLHEMIHSRAKQNATEEKSRISNRYWM